MKRILTAFLLLALVAYGAPAQIGFWQNAAGGAPTITSVTMASAGTTFTSNYSVSVSTGGGGAGGFAATMSGGATTVGSISGLPGTSGTHTSSRTVLMFETGTFSYTQPGNGVEATSGGADVATVSGISVINNSTQMTDTFVRANSGTLGANWTADVGSIGIVSNKASTTNQFSAQRYTATSPGADQIVWIKVDSVPSGGDDYEVYCRVTSGGDGYGLSWDGTNAVILKFTGGGASVLTSSAVSVSAGDWIGFGAVGTALTAYKNGTGATLVSTTDSTYSAAANTGFGMDSSHTAGTLTCSGFIISKQ